MQGNGDFVLTGDSPPQTSPVSLELRDNGDGVISLVASLDDGTEAYLACYKLGVVLPFELSTEISKKLGIQRNMSGTMLSGTSLTEKSHMGC